MHGSSSTAEDRTSKIDQMAEAIVAMFDGRAVAVVSRQIAEAEADEEVRTSWEAILVHVEIILAERDRF
jgi:hypothetical protein